jgi:branched-chain amino acid transport system permease protein
MVTVQFIIDAFGVGGLYALAALGIGLIYGVMRLVNFAHGEFIMIGSYVIYLVAPAWWPFEVALAVAVVVVVAVAIERVAFRPFRYAETSTMMIASFSVSYMLQAIYIMWMGSRAKTVDFLPELNEYLATQSLRIPLITLVSIGTTLIMMLLLVATIQRTMFGIQMRAASENVRMSRMLGVNTNRVIAITFALAGILAATISVLQVAETGTLTPNMGFRFATIGFVATVMGGMGSLTGAALGGFVIGCTSVLLQAALPDDLRPFRESFVYLLVFIVLLVRPGGLIRVGTSMERV